MSGHCAGLVRVLLGLGMAGGVIACHEGSTNGPHDGASAIDAIDAPPQPCWLDTYTPAGTVTLGTGATQYMPMPDMVPLEYGSQDGFDIPVNAQITGLLGGNPSNPLDPSNPRTRFHGFFTDGSPINPGNCGIRIGYQADGTMAHGSAILFDTSLQMCDLFGLQVHIVVEIIDSAGHYATDQKDVICEPPPGWMMGSCSGSGSGSGSG